MREAKRYSPEVKIAAVEKFLSGESKTVVIEQFGISNRGLFNKWLAAYRLHGVEGLKPKPLGRPVKNRDQRLETDAEKIYRLEMENAVLKKFLALRAETKAAQKIKR